MEKHYNVAIVKIIAELTPTCQEIEITVEADYYMLRRHNSRQWYENEKGKRIPATDISEVKAGGYSIHSETIWNIKLSKYAPATEKAWCESYLKQKIKAIARQHADLAKKMYDIASSTKP